MKVVIDINEHLYNTIKTLGLVVEDGDAVAVSEAVKNGIPLVRCENCKYCHKEDESEYWCYGFCSPARLVRKEDFCSYGCKTE